MDRPARSFCPRTFVAVATSRLPRVPSGEPLCPPGGLGASQATQYNVIAFMLVAVTLSRFLFMAMYILFGYLNGFKYRYTYFDKNNF